ncbi:hypothetical protein Tco_1233296, partial [Tanacetum coccineum]
MTVVLWKKNSCGDNVTQSLYRVSTQTEIKDIPIIELSDDEDAVPVKRKCR